MSNYYRITAYHPQEDLSVIIDSNGMFEKLWQFSSYLVQKGFKIVEVGNDEKFTEGDMEKADYDKDHVILRACDKGEPIKNGSNIEVNGKQYNVIN